MLVSCSLALEAPDTRTSLFVDSLKFTTPKGKTVYGGGGIMPDEFVPFDTSGMGYLFTNFRYTTIFQMYAFDFVQHKRDQWKSITSFKETFKVTDELFNNFISYAEKELDFKAEKKGIKQSEKLIRRTIKAEIARQLWEEQGYYSIMNDFDKEVEKCIDVMK